MVQSSMHESYVGTSRLASFQCNKHFGNADIIGKEKGAVILMLLDCKVFYMKWNGKRFLEWWGFSSYKLQNVQQNLILTDGPRSSLFCSPEIIEDTANKKEGKADLQETRKHILLTMGKELKTGGVVEINSFLLLKYWFQSALRLFSLAFY